MNRDFFYYLVGFFTKYNFDKNQIQNITLNSDFQNILDKVLNEHKKTQNSIFKYIFFFIITLFIPFVFYFSSQIIKDNPAIIVAFYLPIFLFSTYFIIAKTIEIWEDFVAFFKKSFVNHIVKEIDENFVYTPKQENFLSENFANFKLDIRYDDARVEDFINGRYLGIDFEISEHYWSSRYYHMHSTAIVCKLKENLNLNFKILNNKFKTFGFLRKFNNFEFNRFFTLKGDATPENIKVLTDKFMQKLIEINQDKNFGKTSVLFKDDKFIIIMENNRDYFEPYLFLKPNLELAKFYKARILKLLGLIKEFDLLLEFEKAEI